MMVLILDTHCCFENLIDWGSYPRNRSTRHHLNRRGIPWSPPGYNQDCNSYPDHLLHRRYLHLVMDIHHSAVLHTQMDNHPCSRLTRHRQCLWDILGYLQRCSQG